MHCLSHILSLQRLTLAHVSQHTARHCSVATQVFIYLTCNTSQHKYFLFATLPSQSKSFWFKIQYRSCNTIHCVCLLCNTQVEKFLHTCFSRYGHTSLLVQDKCERSNAMNVTRCTWEDRLELIVIVVVVVVDFVVFLLFALLLQLDHKKMNK